jgi:1-aminocyclopropane-1-carboxylate deaminase/D-cysteine desulfhydrase-like pyridoxal-dependent ACC family enzyme
MCLQNKLDFKNIKIQSINADWIPEGGLLDVLRLDLLHPVVSGNKWFKLKYYLEDARQKGCTTIATFGGAWSNHIVAAAFACREAGFNSIGIIRGERPAQLSVSLQHASSYGMQLHFVSRADYKLREGIHLAGDGIYKIEEGGYGSLGAKGASEILHFVPDSDKYTHIVCALGTGTMFAGLINSSSPHQTVTGISVLKNNLSAEDEVDRLVDRGRAHGSYAVVHGHHFGGYAKHPPELLGFINQTWANHRLPTDIVYTSKAFYALRQLCIDNLVTAGSRVLFVHSGGLQGNTSLPNGVLSF